MRSWIVILSLLEKNTLSLNLHGLHMDSCIFTKLYRVLVLN